MNALTQEDIESLEQFDIEDDTKRTEVLYNLTSTADWWFDINEKLTKFERQMYIDREDNIVEELYPDIYELNLKLKTLKSLDELFSAYSKLFYFYTELRDPQKFCANITEESAGKLPITLLSVIIVGLMDLRNYTEKNKPECINDQTWKYLADEMLLEFDNFAARVKPEISNIIQNSLISPLYKHYEKYLEIEREKSTTPIDLNMSTPISESISMNSADTPNIDLSAHERENNEARRISLSNRENNPENTQENLRQERVEQNQNDQTDRGV